MTISFWWKVSSEEFSDYLRVRLFSSDDNQNIFSDLSLKRNNYDIIFLDPPYKQGNIDKLIDKIFHKKLLKNKGLIILHRNKKSKENYSKYLKVLDEKNYGISKIMFGTLN